MRRAIDPGIRGFLAVSFLIHIFLITVLNLIPFSLEKREDYGKNTLITIEVLGNSKMIRYTGEEKIKKQWILATVNLSGRDHKSINIEDNRKNIPPTGEFQYGEHSLNESGNNNILNGQSSGDESIQFDKEGLPDGISLAGKLFGKSTDDIKADKKVILDEIRRRVQNAIIYPDKSRRNGHEGRVKVTFYINRYGMITEYRIISSSGWEELDRSVIDALLSINNYPPYDGWITLPVDFRLR